MSFVHSKQSRVMVNDQHLSGSLSGYSLGYSRTMGQTTSLLDDGAKWIPGLMNGSLSLNGRFESGTDSIHETINSTEGADNGLLLTALPDGFNVGKPAYIAVTDLSSYNVEASVSETVNLTVESQPDDGADWGVSLHPHTSETGNGTESSVDHGASTSNGAVATLHVTAVSGTSPTLDVTIQHSPDNSTWADLVSFSQTTASTSERVTVSGSVDRYVRESHTIGGTSPNFTYTVAFARR